MNSEFERKLFNISLLGIIGSESCFQCIVLLFSVQYFITPNCVCVFLQPIHHQYTKKRKNWIKSSVLPDRTCSLVLFRLLLRSESSTETIQIEGVFHLHISGNTQQRLRLPSPLPVLTQCNCLQHIPFLKKYQADIDSIYNKWREYKQVVPTFGAVLLDDTLSHILLVQSFMASWGFPKGKVNQEEDPVDCACREVRISQSP